MGGASLREGSRVRVRGLLTGGELRLTETAVSDPDEGQPPLLREYEALRAKASRLLAESEAGRSQGDQAFEVRLGAFADSLSEHPDVLSEQAISVDDTPVYAFVVLDIERVERTVREAGFSSRIMLFRARWTQEDIERADRIVSALPDSAVVSISGGVSACGDQVMHLVVFDRDEELERSVETLPDGLLSVETWISDI